MDMSKKEPYPQLDEVETRKGAQDIDVKAFETTESIVLSNQAVKFLSNVMCHLLQGP